MDSQGSGSVVVVFLLVCAENKVIKDNIGAEGDDGNAEARE